jgi:NDP-sugar pyrophosphorylase family protein
LRLARFAAKMRGMFRAEDYLNLENFEHADAFDGVEHVWDTLKTLEKYIQWRLKPKNLGKKIGNPFVGDNVFIGEGTTIEHGACVKGPAIIGKNCEIRHGAYIRGNVLAGDGVTFGNSCEFKNCILLNGATVPHFSYVGDSVLGERAHIGAGTILSNLKAIAGNVTVHAEDGKILDTGLRKFGAIIGDFAEIGCNCVLNPGSLIGRNTILYPNLSWRGVCPADSVVKLAQQHHVIARRK